MAEDRLIDVDGRELRTGDTVVVVAATRPDIDTHGYFYGEGKTAEAQIDVMIGQTYKIIEPSRGWERCPLAKVRIEGVRDFFIAAARLRLVPAAPLLYRLARSYRAR